MLTSKAGTREILLHHEPGQSVTIRYLSGAQLKRAREIRSKEVIATYKDIAGIDFSTVQRTQEQQDIDPLTAYDVDTLLFEGIVGWSYDEPVTRDNILDLDEETRDVVAHALIPRQKTEEDRKNGPAESTGTSVGITVPWTQQTNISGS